MVNTKLKKQNKTKPLPFFNSLASLKACFIHLAGYAAGYACSFLQVDLKTVLIQNIFLLTSQSVILFSSSGCNFLFLEYTAAFSHIFLLFCLIVPTTSCSVLLSNVHWYFANSVLLFNALLTA